MHCQFNGAGTSAMDLQSKIIKGRPYGGVVFLIRKSVFQFCTVKEYDDSRILGIERIPKRELVCCYCVYTYLINVTTTMMSI